jgi:hypothetical protein
MNKLSSQEEKVIFDKCYDHAELLINNGYVTTLNIWSLAERIFQQKVAELQNKNT